MVWPLGHGCIMWRRYVVPTKLHKTSQRNPNRGIAWNRIDAYPSRVDLDGVLRRMAMDELAGLEGHPLSQQYPCRVPVWWGRFGDVERDPSIQGVSGRKVVLRIPKEFRRIERIFARLLRAPKELRRPLDRMNSMLWELCDGSRTFEDICTQLNNVFKEEIAPVIHRTTAALHLFQSQNLLLMLDEPLNKRWFVGPGRVPEHQELGPLDESLRIDVEPLESEAA